MLRIGNFKAWIRIDGKNVEEYKVEADTQAVKVTCWVASDVGRVCCSIVLSKSELVKGLLMQWCS